MLLINFIVVFVVFIGYLLIQLEHEEVNWNAELKNKKAEGRRRSKQRRKKQTPANFTGLRIFIACEFFSHSFFLLLLFLISAQTIPI